MSKCPCLWSRTLSSSPKSDLTKLTLAVSDGDALAAGEMFPVIYEELRSLARRYLAGEHVGHTLQPTALVHEAYLKLVNSSSLGARERSHFKAIAAKAMRQTLVDHARAKRAKKRGGDAQKVTLDESIHAKSDCTVEILALDEVLTKLSKEHERMCKVVELRFFGGLKEEEIASALGVSARTVREDWSVAKLWLSRELE